MESWVSNKYVMISSCIIYSVIFVFGLTGNLLVIYSVLRDECKRTVVNVLISNIAVANILFCSFIIPIFTVNLFLAGWTFGLYMCHLWPIVLYTSAFVSSLSLTLIAMNRYSTVFHLTVQRTRKMMWLVSIAASSPLGIFSHYEELSINGDNYCYLKFPSETVQNNYFIVTFAWHVISLTVVASFYIALSLKMPRMSTPVNFTQMADRQTNRVLRAMAIAFFICWMPGQILQLVSVVWNPDLSFICWMPGQIFQLLSVMWNPDFIHWKLMSIIHRIFIIMAMSWTCFTPLFYRWLNRITIKQFYLVGVCCKPQSRESNNVDDSATNGRPCTVLTNLDSADDVTYNAHCDAVNHESVERDWIRPVEE